MIHGCNISTATIAIRKLLAQVRGLKFDMIITSGQRYVIGLAKMAGVNFDWRSGDGFTNGQNNNC